MADLSTQIMALLASRLSLTIGDLAKTLQKPEPEVNAAVQQLQSEQMLHSASDSVTKATLLSPTTKGILAARGLTRFAG
jgi:hypothetical protein